MITPGASHQYKIWNQFLFCSTILLNLLLGMSGREESAGDLNITCRPFPVPVCLPSNPSCPQAVLQQTTATSHAVNVAEKGKKSRAERQSNCLSCMSGNSRLTV